MKKIILLFTVLFSFSVNSQTVMWAVDLKDGAEDGYLKLEEFYSEIHKEGLKQGLRSGWSVWKRTPQEGDEANAAEYIIFDNYSSEETFNEIDVSLTPGFKGLNGVSGFSKNVNLGFESENISHSEFLIISELLTDRTKLIPTNGVVEKIRSIKDQNEIDSKHFEYLNVCFIYKGF